MAKALDLAKECGGIYYVSAGNQTETVAFVLIQLETFYAKTQAQALREAAGKFVMYGLVPYELRRMADELEAGK